MFPFLPLFPFLSRIPFLSVMHASLGMYVRQAIELRDLLPPTITIIIINMQMLYADVKRISDQQYKSRLYTLSKIQYNHIILCNKCLKITKK